MDRSHSVGKCNSKNKCRPIIVKFICYKDCREIFNNKKRLKGTDVSITDSLTAARMLQLHNTRDQFGFNNVWSIEEESCAMIVPVQNQNLWISDKVKKKKCFCTLHFLLFSLG